TVFALAPYYNENIITIIGICLLIGATAKSSQFNSISTLFMIRCYNYSLFQQDIKKVIAYSTMSQLGMMVIAIGLSSYNLALFHLVNHAFYKALLFLGAVYFVATIGAMFTTLYSAKVLYLTFLTNPNGPLVISLSILSVLLSEFLPKLLINFKFTRLGYNIFSFFNQRFYIELFYNKYITEGVLKLGGQTSKSLDKGSVELIGPAGLEKLLVHLSSKLNELSTGVVTTYALYTLLGMLFYIAFLFFNLEFDLLYLLIITLALIATHPNEQKKVNNI
ncbi:NADH-ubiquinone oxidoreductase chain 5, partial [Golovinomyces cichoracearum]